MAKFKSVDEQWERIDVAPFFVQVWKWEVVEFPDDSPEAQVMRSVAARSWRVIEVA